MRLFVRKHFRKMHVKVVPVVLVLQAFVVSFGEALTCYECSSTHRNGNCYTFSNSTSIRTNDCRNSAFINPHYHAPDSEYRCVKYVQREINTNSTTVTRQCIINQNDDFCASQNHPHRHNYYALDECYSCTEDLCNSGSKINTSLFLGVTLVLVVLLKCNALPFV